MTSVSGHWVCERHLGAGGFGVVQLWRNDHTNKMIAVKKCRDDGRLLTEKQKKRWMNEVATMNSLRHPNIVCTVDCPPQLVHLQSPLPVLCMEYCSRGDLREVLNQSSNCCGIEEREAFKIMRHVSSAVQYLHSRNLTHRDLKPENVVILGFGEKITYKLTDLGYVCELGDVTLNGSVVGTLNYLAPELLWKEGYTCSVDYWSLGILFYEVITGRRPFLPDMHVTPTWIKHVQRKSDTHISAREEEGNVIFSDNIESPTTISDCMQKDLAAWFRVALRWDPKKRGKVTDDQGTERLVVFGHLETLLSLKIIQVFVVPLYRVDSYVVDPDISVRQLQTLIGDRTGIEARNQIISDPRCNVLKELDSLLRDCTEDSYLSVFHKDGPRVDEIPPPIMSQPVLRIIAEPRKRLCHEALRRHYSAAVFFVKQQLELFRSYVIALSVCIDLSNMSLEDLREYVNNLRASGEQLTRELTAYVQSPECSRMNDETRSSIIQTGTKLRKLLDSTKEVCAKIDELAKHYDDLRQFSEINWLEKWTILYEKATGYLNSITTVNRVEPTAPVEMVKLLYEALKLQKEQLRFSEIDSVIGRIKGFERDIAQLQAALNSFKGLIDHYRQNYEDIVTKATTETQNPCSATSIDTVIFDNIFMCHLIESIDVFPTPFEDMEL